MKQKLIALFLVVSLAVPFAVSAFALESTHISGAADTNPAAPAAEASPAAAADPAPAKTTEEPVSPDLPAPPNAIKFANIADRVKKNSPAYNAVLSNSGAIHDAQEKVEQIKSGLATIDASLTQIDAALAAIDEVLAPIKKALAEIDASDMSDADKEAAKAPLLAQQAPLLAEQAPYLLQKKALLDQKLQAQSGISGLSSLAGQSTAQLNASAHQIIMGCESMYIALVGLEIQEGALVRQLAALDRTIAELNVRREWGQISQLQLMEAENGRAALVSGLTTLRMNMTNLRMQMENMLGEKITGTLDVGTLPRVTAEQLDAIDLEKDLALVLRRSPAIEAAEDQEDSLYSSGMSSLGGSIWGNMTDAADYGVKSAKLQAEMNFRSLYAELMDCRQVLSAAEAALKVEQLSYQAQELKFNQGAISKNAFLTAADELQTAREAVLTAENNLFSVYNEYNWAVKHGIFM